MSAQSLDTPQAVAAVAAVDPRLADFIARAGPLEPRPGEGDPFAALVRAVVFQQLAGRAAAAIHRRTVDALGGRLTPEVVLATPPDVLRAAGLSAAKTASLIDLAAKSTDGSLALDELAELDDDEVIHRLVSVRGIGRWTAEMFLLFELVRPDVWPVDDYGVRNGWSLIHGLPEIIGPRALRALGEPFRPQRSLVARFCWQAVHMARGQVELPTGTAAR